MKAEVVKILEIGDVVEITRPVATEGKFFQPGYRFLISGKENGQWVLNSVHGDVLKNTANFEDALKII